MSSSSPTLGVWFPDERRAPHPLICCAVDGLGPLGHEFLDGRWPGEDVRRVRRLVARMTTGDEGPALAFVNLPDAPRPLVLMQPGLLGYGTAAVGATIAQAIATAGELWSPVELQLAHPLEGGWPLEALDAIAAGIAGGAYRADDLERLSLDGCCLTSPGALLGAVARVRSPAPAPGLTVLENDDGVLLGSVDVARRVEPVPPNAIVITTRSPAPPARSRRCRPGPPQAHQGSRPDVLVSNLPDAGRLDLRIDGRALDGFLESQIEPLGEDVRRITDAVSDEPIGLQVRAPFDLDLDDPAYDPLWDSPAYDVPALGLHAVSIGHILAVALMQLDPDEETPDRERFDTALALQSVDWELALEQWRACLDHGDQMAHFAVGYSLMELDRPAEAKEPLRRYSRLDPNNAWAWVWLGHACWALGDFEGAEYAYTAAISRTALGSYDTDAPKLLERVRRRDVWGGLGASVP